MEFEQTKEMLSDIDSWDVTAIQDMSELFKDETSFNSDISSWDVSDVTNMTSMFEEQKVISIMFYVNGHSKVT